MEKEKITESNKVKKSVEEKVNEEWKVLDKLGKGGKKEERHTLSYLSETLETTRPVKVTKGGRQFSFTGLVLIKDKSTKAVAYARGKGKDAITALKKARRKAQKKLIGYFPNPPRTVPRQITVKDGATKIFLKPAPPGSGIKAGGVLNTLFRYLEIKDVSAKIIGSSNKSNVIRVAFLALDKLTGKKYEY